jgi:hypothetical protein
MTDARELSRRRARMARATVRDAEVRKAVALIERVGMVLFNARRALDDATFRHALKTHGIADVPALQVPASPPPEPRDASSHGLCLEFVVAWRFFYPLFSDAAMVEALELTQPGFIAEIKDVFIALVTDGPFPHAISGFRGRRHKGTDFAP